MKFTSGLLLFVFASAFCFAQEDQSKTDEGYNTNQSITAFRKKKEKLKHRRPQLLQFSYGYRSLTHLFAIRFADEQSATLTSYQPKFSGPWMLDMQSYFDGNWSGGLTFAIDRYKGRLEKKTDTSMLSTEYSSQVIILLPFFMYHWVQSDKWNGYSGIGAGYGFASNSESGNFRSGRNEGAIGGFTYHLTLAGVRFGKTIGAFAEVGIGDLGLVRAGISGRF